MKKIKKWHLHKKPQNYKGKITNHYAIAESFRDENNKNQKRRIKSLGALTDEDAFKWKLKLKAFNGDIENIAFLDEMKFIESKKYLDIALLSSVYDALGIGDVFSNVKTEDRISTADIAKVLTLSRCINPTAHYKISDFVSDSYLPELMNIEADKCNKDKIFRELDNIYSSRKKLQKLFYNLSLEHRNPDELELYFFDGTTSYFEGSSCELAEPARDKTSGYQNRVILICLLTDKKGYPIIWDVFSGKKKDTTEFKTMAQDMAKVFGIKEVTICFDRGVASSNNFDFIDKRLDSKYISGLDKDQFCKVFNTSNFVSTTKNKLIKNHEETEIELKNKKNNTVGNLKEELARKPRRIIPININGFYKLGKDRFYKELGVIDGKRYVVSFNVSICEASKETRLNNIEKVKNKIEVLNKELKLARKDRDSKPVEEKIELLIKKYQVQGIINYKIIPIAVNYNQNTVQSYKITYSINKDEIVKKEEEDGILVYISNHTKCEKGIYEISALDIVAHYKNKYVIENAFRHIKSFIDLRPFNVYLKEHVIAHVDICMLAYFINTYIYHKLFEAGFSLEKFYSIIKSQSRTCTILTGTSNEPVTLLKSLSKETVEIVELLGSSFILSKEVMGKLKIIK